MIDVQYTVDVELKKKIDKNPVFFLIIQRCSNCSTTIESFHLAFFCS